MMRPSRAILLALGLAAVQAHGQTPLTNAPSLTTNLPSALAEESDAARWSFSASAYAYFVPDSREYVQPTFTADRDWLHLEARYNYENIETGSAWVGYNFSGGKKLEWELTPMLGGVFGNTTGIVPRLQRLAELVETRTLQRRPVRLRHA
jgi:hypothetical protein